MIYSKADVLKWVMNKHLSFFYNMSAKHVHNDLT